MIELQEKGKIVWKMNTSKAPHEAEVWERLVKPTKHVLLKICLNSLLNYVKFQTVLKETQALLKDRPFSSSLGRSCGRNYSFHAYPWEETSFL